MDSLKELKGKIEQYATKTIVTQIMEKDMVRLVKDFLKQIKDYVIVQSSINNLSFVKDLLNSLTDYFRNRAYSISPKQRIIIDFLFNILSVKLSYPVWFIQIALDAGYYCEEYGIVLEQYIKQLGGHIIKSLNIDYQWAVLSSLISFFNKLDDKEQYHMTLYNVFFQSDELLNLLHHTTENKKPNKIRLFLNILNSQHGEKIFSVRCSNIMVDNNVLVSHVSEDYTWLDVNLKCITVFFKLNSSNKEQENYARSDCNNPIFDIVTIPFKSFENSKARWSRNNKNLTIKLNAPPSSRYDTSSQILKIGKYFQIILDDDRIGEFYELMSSIFGEMNCATETDDTQSVCSSDMNSDIVDNTDSPKSVKMEHVEKLKTDLEKIDANNRFSPSESLEFPESQVSTSLKRNIENIVEMSDSSQSSYSEPNPYITDNTRSQDILRKKITDTKQKNSFQFQKISEKISERTDQNINKYSQISRPETSAYSTNTKKIISSKNSNLKNTGYYTDVENVKSKTHKMLQRRNSVVNTDQSLNVSAEHFDLNKSNYSKNTETNVTLRTYSGKMSTRSDTEQKLNVPAENLDLKKSIYSKNIEKNLTPETHPKKILSRIDSHIDTEQNLNVSAENFDLKKSIYSKNIEKNPTPETHPKKMFRRRDSHIDTEQKLNVSAENVYLEKSDYSKNTEKYVTPGTYSKKMFSRRQSYIDSEQKPNVSAENFDTEKSDYSKKPERRALKTYSSEQTKQKQKTVDDNEQEKSIADIGKPLSKQDCSKASENYGSSNDMASSSYIPKKVFDETSYSDIEDTKRMPPPSLLPYQSKKITKPITHEYNTASTDVEDLIETPKKTGRKPTFIDRNKEAISENKGYMTDVEQYAKKRGRPSKIIKTEANAKNQYVWPKKFEKVSDGFFDCERSGYFTDTDQTTHTRTRIVQRPERFTPPVSFTRRRRTEYFILDENVTKPDQSPANSDFMSATEHDRAKRLLKRRHTIDNSQHSDDSEKRAKQDDDRRDKKRVSSYISKKQSSSKASDPVSDKVPKKSVSLMNDKDDSLTAPSRKKIAGNNPGVEQLPEQPEKEIWNLNLSSDSSLSDDLFTMTTRKKKETPKRKCSSTMFDEFLEQERKLMSTPAKNNEIELEMKNIHNENQLKNAEQNTSKENNKESVEVRQLAANETTNAIATDKQTLILERLVASIEAHTDKVSQILEKLTAIEATHVAGIGKLSLILEKLVA